MKNSDSSNTVHTKGVGLGIQMVYCQLLLKALEVMILSLTILILGILVPGMSPSVAMANGSGFSTELFEQIQRIEASIIYEIPQLSLSDNSVQQIEKRIDAIIRTAEHIAPQELKALLNTADDIVKIRQQHQGARWWETIDAQQRLQNFRKWASVTAKDRAAWAHSFSLDRQARELSSSGKHREAKPLYEQALGIREQVLGGDHLDTATSLDNLARMCHAQDQYSQALPLYQRVLEIREKVLGPDHPDTAECLSDLAVLYSTREQYAQAQLLAERVIAIREKVYRPDHPDTAMALNNLAVLYHLQNKYVQALPLYQRALSIREKVLEPDHPDTAKSLNDLAVLYIALGQSPMAQPLYQRALAIREKVLGPDHPTTAAGLEDLALATLDHQPDETSAQLLLKSTEYKWKYFMRTFPTLSFQVQQQFLSRNSFRKAPQYFWPLFAALPTLERATGLQATLLSKQLMAEASRQANSALQQVLADAPPAWRTLWHQREDLRQQYATRALEEMLDHQARPRPTTQSAKEPASTRDLSDQIEQVEEQLRRENPAYAVQAKVEQISVEQVRAALRPQELLLEYVDFRTYDKTKGLTFQSHYGVYLLRGDHSPVVAIDLGEAAPIEDAVNQILLHMRNLIDESKEMTPSLKRLRQSEAELAEASVALRTLILAPLETHLKGIKRVYVAPESSLSSIPFEILPKKTKQGNWRYFVEDQEVVYLNTGRDLARLASTSVTPSPSASATKQAVLAAIGIERDRVIDKPPDKR